jgi:transposase
VWQHCYCASPGQACPPQFDLGPIGPELAPGWRIVDSTHVKVHADGSNTVGGQASQAVRRTKGGLNTKIHAVVIALSGGNQADISLAEELTECLPQDSTLIGDKAYDSSTLRQKAATKGINTYMPGRSNRTMTVPFSTTVYRRRHRVENFFARIKRYRRVATRYDKLAETFLGFVCLALLFTLRLT